MRRFTAAYAGVSMSRVVLVVVLAALTSGCGLKGDLYLPEKSGTLTSKPVIVTPTSSSSSSSSAVSSQASP